MTARKMWDVNSKCWEKNSELQYINLQSEKKSKLWDYKHNCEKKLREKKKSKIKKNSNYFFDIFFIM